MWKRDVISVKCAIKITNGNYLFKIDSTVIRGKYMLSGTTRYSSVVVRKHEFRIVSFLSLLQDLLVQLISYLVSVIQHIVTAVILSFCYVQNTRKSKKAKCWGLGDSPMPI